MQETINYFISLLCSSKSDGGVNLFDITVKASSNCSVKSLQVLSVLRNVLEDASARRFPLSEHKHVHALAMRNV